MRPRNAHLGPAGYAEPEPVRAPVQTRPGGSTVQSTQPRDVAALALVVGLFLILFVITVLFGAPAR